MSELDTAHLLADPAVARLYALLPGLYRGADERAVREGAPSGPYLRLLAALGTSLSEVRQGVFDLWASFFIDTCPDWVVPLLAARLGVEPLPNAAWAGREEVARTVAWRLRKGTPAVLADLARVLAGAAVDLFEGFRILARTTYLTTPCHIDAVVPRIELIAPALRDRHHHSFDGAGHRPGWYGPTRVGMGLVLNDCHPVRGGSPQPVATTPGRFAFRPTGVVAPLFDIDDRHPLRWEGLLAPRPSPAPEPLAVEWLGAPLTRLWPAARTPIQPAGVLASAAGFPAVEKLAWLSHDNPPAPVAQVQVRVFLGQRDESTLAMVETGTLATLTVRDWERQSLTVNSVDLSGLSPEAQSALPVLLEVTQLGTRWRRQPPGTLSLRAPRSSWRAATQPNLRLVGTVLGTAYAELPELSLAAGQQRTFYLGVDGALYDARSGGAWLSAAQAVQSSPVVLPCAPAWPVAELTPDIEVGQGLAQLGRRADECLRCVDESLVAPGTTLRAYRAVPGLNQLPNDTQLLAEAVVGGSTTHGAGLDLALAGDQLLLVLAPPAAGAPGTTLPHEWILNTRSGANILCHVPAVDLAQTSQRLVVYVDRQGSTYGAVVGALDGVLDLAQALPMLRPGDRSPDGAFHTRHRLRSALGPVLPVAGIRPIQQRPATIRPPRPALDVRQGPPLAVHVCVESGQMELDTLDPLRQPMGSAVSPTQCLAAHPEWLTTSYQERTLGRLGAVPGGAPRLDGFGLPDRIVQVSASGRYRRLVDPLTEPDPQLAWFPSVAAAVTALTTGPAAATVAGLRVLIEILDDRTLTETVVIDIGTTPLAALAIASGASARGVIQAVSGQPAVRVTGSRPNGPFDLLIEGLLLAGSVRWEADAQDAMVVITACDIQGQASRLQVIAPTGGVLDVDVTVTVSQSAVAGAELVGPARLVVRDSLVGEAGILAEPAELPAGDPDGDGPRPQKSPRADVCLERTTVLGPISAGVVRATSSLIWPTGEEQPGATVLTIDDGQSSCLRYSRTPRLATWSGTARTFRCHDEPPLLMERRMGHPDLATVGLRATRCVLRGGEQGCEQGAGAVPARSLRLDNLQTRFGEYAPMGALLRLVVHDGG